MDAEKDTLPENARPSEVLMWIAKHPEVDAATVWFERFPKPRTTPREYFRLYGYPVTMIIMSLTLVILVLTEVL